MMKKEQEVIKIINNNKMNKKILAHYESETAIEVKNELKINVDEQHIIKYLQ